MARRYTHAMHKKNEKKQITGNKLLSDYITNKKGER